MNDNLRPGQAAVTSVPQQLQLNDIASSILDKLNRTADMADSIDCRLYGPTSCVTNGQCSELVSLEDKLIEANKAIQVINGKLDEILSRL